MRMRRERGRGDTRKGGREGIRGAKRWARPRSALSRRPGSARSFCACAGGQVRCFRCAKHPIDCIAAVLQPGSSPAAPGQLPLAGDDGLWDLEYPKPGKLDFTQPSAFRNGRGETSYLCILKTSFVGVGVGVLGLRVAHPAGFASTMTDSNPP